LEWRVRERHIETVAPPKYNRDSIVLLLISLLVPPASDTDMSLLVAENQLQLDLSCIFRLLVPSDTDTKTIVYAAEIQL
jgi:hypothetical protein